MFAGQTVTTVWEEKLYNARLTKPLSEFIDTMDNLNLAYPKKMGNYSILIENFLNSRFDCVKYHCRNRKIKIFFA